MQSLVEDVNSAVVTYRNHFLQARKDQNMPMIETAIRGLNALLSNKYKLIFDTAAYRKQTAIVDTVECPRCKNKIRLDEQKILYELKTTKLAHLTDGRTASTPYVICKHKHDRKLCKMKVSVNNDNIIRIIYDDLQIQYAPEPPTMGNLLERVTQHSSYYHWADTVWHLLEAQHQKYRDSYSTAVEVVA